MAWLVVFFVVVVVVVGEKKRHFALGLGALLCSFSTGGGRRRRTGMTWVEVSAKLLRTESRAQESNDGDIGCVLLGS